MLGGDFDATPEAASVRFWRADLDRRIDYLMIRCDAGGGPTLRVTHCARILTTPIDGSWPTDHFGLLADLEPA